MPSEVKNVDYDEIWARVEEAYRRCADAEEFLQELLHIWAEYGIVQGEWSCSLDKAV